MKLLDTYVILDKVKGPRCFAIPGRHWVRSRKLEMISGTLSHFSGDGRLPRPSATYLLNLGKYVDACDNRQREG